MHRTEGANNLAGLFTEGPPATTVTEEWLNAIQEEIANVIESAGIVLKSAAGDTRDQLRAALLQTVPMPRGYIDGLIMSNGTDTAHDIDIAVGKSRDSGDSESILFNAAMTKQIDAAWALGTNAGGFPTGVGVVGNDTWYHVFVIAKLDGTVDAGFDTSLIATNLLADATDFVYCRRIGSVLTDGSANIYQFIQIGDAFIWVTPENDFANAATGAAENTGTLRVPLGVNAISYYCYGATGGGFTYIRHPDTADIQPTAAGPSQYLPTAGTTYIGKSVHTDKNSQVKYRTFANNSIFVQTVFYVDFRGKDL